MSSPVAQATWRDCSTGQLSPTGKKERRKGEEGKEGEEERRKREKKEGRPKKEE